MQDEISTLIGVSYRAYTSYEHGERKPSYEFLEKLFEKFNVNLNWLITAKSDMFNQSTPDFEQTKKELFTEIKKAKR